MEYRVLGKTGLKISRLGFGGIPIQRIDAAGTKVLMQKLLEAGVNYIDTARGYTVSEAFLGEALEGIREHFVLAQSAHGLHRPLSGAQPEYGAARYGRGGRRCAGGTLGGARSGKDRTYRSDGARKGGLCACADARLGRNDHVPV